MKTTHGKSLKAKIVSFAKKLAPTMLTSTFSWTSSGVMSKKPLNTAEPALKSPTRIWESGQCFFIASNALCSSVCVYALTGKPAACQYAVQSI